MAETVHIPHRSEFSLEQLGSFSHQMIVYLESIGAIAIAGEEALAILLDLTNVEGSTMSLLASLRAEVEELKKEVHDNRSLAL